MICLGLALILIEQRACLLLRAGSDTERGGGGGGGGGVSLWGSFSVLVAGSFSIETSCVLLYSAVSMLTLCCSVLHCPVAL